MPARASREVVLINLRLFALGASAALFFFAVNGARGQAAAFPTADNAAQQHVLPTDLDDVFAPLPDPDNPEIRERNAADDAKITRDEAARARKRSAAQPAAVEDPLLAEIPDAPVVKEIEVAGVDGMDLKKAMRAIVTREGEPLNPDKQREDIKKLYDIGQFKPDIQVDAEDVPGGVKLRYLVEPNPKVGAINVTGNVKVPSNKIIGELPVKAGEVYTVQAQNKIRDTISRFYEEKGYGDAAIHVEERPGTGNTVDLQISVDEGTKTKIRNLVIQGNQHVSDLSLKLHVNNKGSWGPFKHYYNDAKFEEDLNTAKAVMADKGFLDADVKRGDFVYAEDRSWVDPVIQVAEGPQYKFGRLEARGFSIYSRDEILEPFRSLQGQVYSPAEFNKRAQRIKNMYGDEGFLNCSIEPELHKDPNTGTVDVDLDISEGSRIYVGDVKVVSQAYPEDTERSWLRRVYSRFSPPVKDEVVRREVRMRPGQVYRRFDEVRTKERLKSLNVFDDVKVNEQMTDNPNVHDCIVEVEQGNTGNLIFGAGFGDVEGGFLYANYIEHNLFGLARDLKVSGLIGSKALSGEISYLDRYFLGSDIAAQFTAFHRRFDRTGAFQQTNTGITAEFTRPLSECLKDSFRVRLEDIGYELNHSQQPRERLDDYLAATLRYKICHDTRDDMFFPTYGHVAAASFETGTADGFLAKLEGQYAQYWQVCDNWVVANNTIAGFMPYDATRIGYADRFFLGGGSDLRGFRVGGAGQHDSDNASIPLGGSTKLLNQLEARRLITDNLAGVVFADVGMLGRRAFEIGTPRASVGTGVRMRLPMASVSLDLAVPVISRSDDQTQLFHFNVTSAW
jgi:outer membrane protein insertion porin family